MNHPAHRRHRAGKGGALPMFMACAAAMAALAGCAPSSRVNPPVAPTAAQPPALTAVDALVTETWRAMGGDFPMAVHVRDRQNRLVYARSLGGFDAAQPMPVASASKLVTGLLLLRLVDQGKLGLEDTTAQQLGWSGDRGRITLRQLLAQISGLKPQAACVQDTRSTLRACVDAIRDDPTALAHAPGSHFDYGSTHFQVAARMAEVATGRSWAQLFEAELAQPLALQPHTVYQTAPWFGRLRGEVGASANPQTAGGLVTSLADYERLLALVFHRGEHSGHRLVRGTLFDDMATVPNAAASVGSSPMARAARQPYLYGLGVWAECVPARVACPQISSAGAFGWTPWIDREAGYYAVIAMYRLPGGGLAATRGVVDASVQLQQRLKPALAQALRAVRGEKASISTQP